MLTRYGRQTRTQPRHEAGRDGVLHSRQKSSATPSTSYLQPRVSGEMCARIIRRKHTVNHDSSSTWLVSWNNFASLRQAGGRTDGCKHMCAHNPNFTPYVGALLCPFVSLLLCPLVSPRVSSMVSLASVFNTALLTAIFLLF